MSCASCSDGWRLCVERATLMTWLLKDLGWMTTNVYLGWLFGILAVIFHIIAAAIDWPKSVPFRFYHISLLCWIIGNLLWMSVEFMRFEQSSMIHFGPDLPLPGMDQRTGDLLTNIKSWLFIFGILVQIMLFVCIGIGYVPMPTYNDGVQSIFNHITGHGSAITDDQAKCCGPFSKISSTGMTLTFIENMYIILWISKDYFWSWATGDFEITLETAYFTQVIALFFGILILLLFSFLVYSWRNDFVNFTDSLTCLCWLSADFVWMVGEICIRYRYTELDDSNQDDDSTTRIVSAILFGFGLLLQLVVFVHFLVMCFRSQSNPAYLKLRKEDQEEENVELVATENI